jgi:Skp family chaperone for outer membrane proteins
MMALHKPSGVIPVLSTRVRGGARLRYDLFERAVLATVAVITLSDLMGHGDKPSEAEERLATARARHTELTQRRRQIQALLADSRLSVADLAPALAENGEALRAAEDELKAAQWEAESTRGDSLSCVQSLHDALLTAKGEELQELRQRIKETLPTILEGIAVRRIGAARRGARYLATIRFRGGVERVVEVDSSVRYGT